MHCKYILKFRNYSKKLWFAAEETFLVLIHADNCFIWFFFLHIFVEMWSFFSGFLDEYNVHKSNIYLKQKPFVTF